MSPHCPTPLSVQHQKGREAQGFVYSASSVPLACAFQDHDDVAGMVEAVREASNIPVVLV